MKNPDRFDRMALGLPPPTAVPPATVTATYINSTRGPRFVDHGTCSMCGVERLGIEYHGELRSGAKVHQFAAHSEGRRSVQSGRPRCLGAGMRVVFEGGTWRGATL